MTRSWKWPLPLGLVLGVIAGFCLSLWMLSPLPEPKRAQVLETFDFQEALEGGNTAWKIIHDGEPWEKSNRYYLGPWMGESSAITRQIVAQTTLSQREQTDFVVQLRSALNEAIASQGGQSDPGPVGSQRSKDDDQPTQWSRYHYYLGGMRGMIEMVLVGQGEHVTLFLAFAEVRATARSWPLGDIPLFRRSSGMP